MANISTQLAAIMSAIYGRDVRQSIHDGIDEINKVTEVAFTTGTTDPTGNARYSGLLYLNTETDDIFKSNAQSPYAWSKIGNLQGNSIVNITKTGSDPTTLVDTYTIGFTKRDPITFEVTNGRGITEITGPVSSGLVDTYTIHYSNNTTDTFNVTNGKGIKSVVRTAQEGTLDTYTITFDDDTTFLYNVNQGNRIFMGVAVQGRIDTSFISQGFVDNYCRVGDTYINTESGDLYMCVKNGIANGDSSQDPTPRDQKALWKWEFQLAGGGTGIASLSSIPNVDISNPKTGDLLTCNIVTDPVTQERTEKWINRPLTVPTVDQSYSPTSRNAQSGTAVAEAIKNGVKNTETALATFKNVKLGRFELMPWESDIVSQLALDGIDVWTDGTNVYYSHGTAQRKLEGNTWVDFTWNGLTDFYGQNVWTDGTNIYYSVGTSQSQYKLNGTTWEPKSWNMDHIWAFAIWTDGTNIYHSVGQYQYKLENGSWVPVTWSGLSIELNGQYIWTDGTNIYYSISDAQYKLNGTTWEPVTWSGSFTTPDGSNIWTDGTDIYYSFGLSQYRLNGATWESVTWATGGWPTGSYVWSDGTDLYYSYGGQNYKYNGSNWIAHYFTEPLSFYGQDIWTDGTDIYYSNDSKQYKLNGTKWESMTWRGELSSGFAGRYIWSDGEDIYFSRNDGFSIQCKLSKNTSSWTYWADHWSGLTDFDASDIWTDGAKIYYTHNGDTYELVDKEEWDLASWNSEEVKPTEGNTIFVYNNVIYAAEGYACMYFTGSSWKIGVMRSDFNFLSAEYVWSDGVNIYYSTDSSAKFKLVCGGYEFLGWGQIEFANAPAIIDGRNIWTDGTDIYYSNGDAQYKINFTPFQKVKTRL